MPAMFSLASADVVIHTDTADGDTTHTGVQITVRNGKATLSTGRGVGIETKDGVLISTRQSKANWSVTFTDGTVWNVTRSKSGCRKCGG